MLQVKTKVKESAIAGVGLFADEFIPKGTITWKFLPGFDLEFTKDQILSFPQETQIFISTYSWKCAQTGKYLMSLDNEKFINHSDEPNIVSTWDNNFGNWKSEAIRDIYKGEEIVDDYNNFEIQDDEENILFQILRENTQNNFVTAPSANDTLKIKRLLNDRASAHFTILWYLIKNSKHEEKRR